MGSSIYSISSLSANLKSSNSTSPQKKTTPVEEFLVKYASSITAEIDKVKEEGAGFFAYYEVDAALADEEFMKIGIPKVKHSSRTEAALVGV